MNFETGEQIKILRILLRCSQMEFAILTGLSRKKIAAIERDRHKIPYSLRNFCQLMDYVPLAVALDFVNKLLSAFRNGRTVE